jgi:hypothetical protein
MPFRANCLRDDVITATETAEHQSCACQVQLGRAWKFENRPGEDFFSLIVTLELAPLVGNPLAFAETPS